MPRDSRSLSSQFLQTRVALRAIGLLVNASVLLSGCATSNSLSVMPFRSNDSGESSTVRSQDESLSSPQSTTDSSRSASADYSLFQSRLETRGPDAGGDFGRPATMPGHSFLLPKARLGRPIPLPENADVVNDAPAEISSQGAVAGENQIDEAVPVNSREGFDRTPWPSGNTSAWHSVNETVPDWGHGDATFSETGTDDPASPFYATLPSGFAQESLNQTAEVSTDVEVPESIVGKPASEESASIPPISEPSSDSKAELAPMPEPTMLDRFRGLYTPRLEDNTDKLKKQIRRWPDPFWLLKDRDETSEFTTGSATAPLTEPESSPTAAVPQSEAAASTTEPADSPLDIVIADLETVLADWPGTPSGRPERLNEWRQRQTDLRLLYMISGRSAESIRVIESLPEEEQEFWQSLMLSMHLYRETRNDMSRGEQLSQALDHLRDASKKLQPLSTLQILHMTFCDRIDGFGNVSAFPTADFNPGQRILVYADVQNFRSELTAEGIYRTEFAAVIEFMRQGNDEIVETIRIPQILDHCNVERTDYFQSFEVTLPALAGTYTVRIRLRDQLSLQTAESELEFNVRSQNSGL